MSVGALGVLATVTLQCVPAFTLAADKRPMVPLAHFLQQPISHGVAENIVDLLEAVEIYE